jgi:hypothetical protein
MPVVILGTEMERGQPKWRARTSGLEGEGPVDKTLIIEFTGNLNKLPGFNGRSLNMAELRQDCVLVRQDWIPAEGIFPCSVRVGTTSSVVVDLS